MSGMWKNPNSPQEHPSSSSLWESPKVDLSKEKDNSVTVSLAVKGLIGFLVVCSLNALALFLFANAIGFNLEYQNAVLASVVYVCWRLYDIVVFNKIRRG